MRRSAFAVLGDLSRVCWSLVQPHKGGNINEKARPQLKWVHVVVSTDRHVKLTCLAFRCSLITDEFMWALIQNLNSDYPAACNNATWALGEVAMHLGEEGITITIIGSAVMAMILSIT